MNFESFVNIKTGHNQFKKKESPKYGKCWNWTYVTVNGEIWTGTKNDPILGGKPFFFSLPFRKP